jgi:hypothetical protein
LNAAFIELFGIAERAVTLMGEKIDEETHKTWAEVGGPDLVHVVNTMAPALFEAVVLYDDDASDYVDLSHTLTLNLTSSFAF